MREALRGSELFASLDDEALDDVAAMATVLDIRGGSTLFESGSPSDSLYLVVTGRLRALTSQGAIGEIGAFETVGEMGLVSGDVRTARVIAVRDTRLIKLKADALMQVLLRHPQALLSLTRIIIQRLQYNQRQQRRAGSVLRSLALISVLDEPQVRACQPQLIEALARFRQVRVLDKKTVDADLGAMASAAAFDDTDANAKLNEYLNDAERECDLVIYLAGPEPGPWLRRCLRQADRVLLMADASVPPAQSEVLDEMAGMTLGAAVECLLRTDGESSPHTLKWREMLEARAHYFWRPGSAADIDSLARQLTNRGVGLVLGGGGARGFAHIGLVRALEELEVPVDLAGGSSMGAFMAALVASDYDADDMTRIAHETFVEHNYLNDYMLPRVALIRGRKFLRRLHEIFGDRKVEDLPKPYYCLSTNLTRGQPMVHDRGPLAIWVGTSMSVPGVAPPVGYQGDLLADGSVVNSLPTDVMLELGRGPIIASNVSTEGVVRAPGVKGPEPEALLRWTSEEPRPGLLDILFRTATLTSESGTRARAACADIYLRMPVADCGIFDWDALDTLSAQGYDFAMRELEGQREKLLAPESTEPLI